jgi:hypothetical protein
MVEMVVHLQVAVAVAQIQTILVVQDQVEMVVVE